MRYAIDVPDTYELEVWSNVAYFDTKEEAILFVKEKFGGDDEGRISLISEV